MYKLQLYGTLGCHLCEEAERWLALHLPPEYSFDKVDIADSEQMVEQYGVRIPVLSNGIDECDWPFDQVQLDKVMATAPEASRSVVAERHTPTSRRRVFHIQSNKE